MLFLQSTDDDRLLYETLYAFESPGRRPLFSMIKQLMPDTYLTTLPNELLDLIAQLVDMKTALSLRHQFLIDNPECLKQDVLEMAHRCGILGNIEDIKRFLHRHTLHILEEAIRLNPLPPYFAPIVRGSTKCGSCHRFYFMDHSTICWKTHLAWHDHRDAALIILRSFPQWLASVSTRLLDDTDVVRVAVAGEGPQLEYASARLQDERETVMIAVTSKDDDLYTGFFSGRALGFASTRLQEDRELVLEALLDYGPALMYASLQLRDDYEVVKLAVSQTGRMLEYASERLRDDYQMVQIAVKKDGAALLFASERHQNDIQLVRLAVAQNGSILPMLNERFRDDFDIVCMAFRPQGHRMRAMLEFVSDRLQDNLEVATVAVAQCSSNCSYASPRLLDDFDFINMALKRSAWALEWASERLKQDPILQLKANKREYQEKREYHMTYRSDSEYSMDSD